MKRMLCMLSTVLAVLLLAAPLCALASDGEAADLTKRCTLDAGSYKSAPTRILSRNMDHYQVFDANTSFSFSWKDDVPAAQLCVQWHVFPEQVTVSQYDGGDELLCSETLRELPETITPLQSGTRRVVVTAGEQGMEVYYCRVYGEGEPSDPFHTWIDTPEKLDYLLISTHPDDDVIYLGSVVPTYGAEQGYVGTIAYVTCRRRERMTEAEDGAWAMGLRYRPLFLGFPDVARNAPQEEKDEFRYEDVLSEIVRLYRRYRPAVVFAQDKNGEYGHWQHKLTSAASVEAASLAADPSYDPESAAQYGTWQVQKVFLHMYEENHITIDAHTPLTFFGGDDAYQVARKAFQKHKSQKDIGYAVTRDRGEFAFNQFGMAFGAVEVGTDVFDNIDETCLSSYVPPTPEPTEEPTPEPTPEPTQEPTQEPAAEPTEAPEPTPAPAETPAPTAEPAPQKPDRGRYLPIVCGALLCAAIACAAVLIARKRSK